ncbi:MAG: hypothetical protein HZB26_04080 [Candidatus Hydrogenedentes bacterium]|nr:hypothetical protein [Candidatus Hydrogenedentota bacterium]
MTTWTNDAHKCLEAYLNQVNALLQGQSVDTAEVVDDLRNHVTNLADGSGNSLITEPDLQRILATLGSPVEVAHSWTGKDPADPWTEPYLDKPWTEPDATPSRNSSTKWIALPIVAGVLVTLGIAFMVWEQRPGRGQDYSIRVSPPSDSRATVAASNPLYLAGDWHSVDFVEHVENFKPGAKFFTGDLFLKELHCLENGDTSLPVTWKDGWITDKQSQIRAQYEVKTLNGEIYLFWPWLSGDVTTRGQQPKYYVLKRGAVSPEPAQQLATPDSAPTIPPSNAMYLAGVWRSVDFVDRAERFTPGAKAFPGDLFLKELRCFENGATSLPVTWKDGWITDKQSQIRARYEVKTLNGQVYLFLPWLSGDVTIRGQQPKYYVLQKTSN